MKHPNSTPSPSNSSCQSSLDDFTWEDWKMYGRVIWMILCGCLVSSPGCSSEPPAPPVKMKCVAVHVYDGLPDMAIMEDERGNRVKVTWHTQLPVVGDTWMVQDGELLERVREPE